MIRLPQSHNRLFPHPGTQIVAFRKTQFMTLLEFVALLVVAAICGSVGQALAGYDLGGCLVSIVVGFIGAYIGIWISQKMGWPEFLTIKLGNKQFPIIWAVIGSAVFTLVVGLIRKAISGPRRL